MTHERGAASNRTQLLMLAALFALVLSLLSLPVPQVASVAAGRATT